MGAELKSLEAELIAEAKRTMGTLLVWWRSRRGRSPRCRLYIYGLAGRRA